MTNPEWIIPSEYFNNYIPAKTELEKRSNGCLFHSGKVYSNIQGYLTEKQINLIDGETAQGTKEINGNTASPGKASEGDMVEVDADKGIVKKI